MRSIRLPRNLLLAGLACAAASAALAQVPEPPHGAAPCSPSGHALHPVDLHPGPPGEGRGGPPEAGPLEGPLPPFLHGLDLSEEQQDRVFAIVHELVPKLRQQARAARKAHEQLHQMSLGETYDEARARGELARESVTVYFSSQ